ncbi:HIT family protein [Roseospira marina]|uniref:HIT family protein n=1 Tax=Roseospira marina TaxID=140057 RepID=A0A5M6I7H2_9PROT|nr:HIT family protein [Roseospira marina]KAA5604062.1 HIT family protein [Roseospira marina]MBB4315857.1 diadenosine tetraphosphate (Ap4A) HIT family hydrolase [Roseospira marina]MBB5089003.1 diadenosine tetraphosphate (Ap4A) HIT family hydrolase [Roseospira marina]
MTDATPRNATMQKFGYPGTLVTETPHWVVLVRPQQVTLGSLVVVCREPATAFGQISPAAFADLGPVMAGVEATLRAFVSYEKINHLMLMMVDPDVHFHVIPRYAEPRRFEDVAFPDAGWPAVPALGTAVTPSPDTLDRIVATLRDRWTGHTV